MVGTLDTILDVWYKHPELRLGQLLEAACHRSTPSKVLFYVSDVDLETLVKALDKEIEAYKPCGEQSANSHGTCC